MEKWWDSTDKGLTKDYFQQLQREFKTYKSNIYLLHKVLLLSIIGCLKNPTLVSF